MSDYNANGLPRAERAARVIKKLQAQIADLEDEIETQKAYLAHVLPEGGVVGDDERGWLNVQVYQYRKYDEAYGKKAHPELWEAHAQSKLVLDSATAKRELSSEEYALFQKPSDKKTVKIEPVDD